MADLRGQQLKDSYQDVVTRGGGKKLENGNGVEFADLDDKASLLSNQLTVSVGDGGDYQTINEALIDLSKNKPKYIGGDPVSATVNLLEGFVMSEQVFCYEDYSWIYITSEDPEVTIQRSSLTEFCPVEGWQDRQDSVDHIPAFAALRGGKTPVISCLFNMDNSGDSEKRTGLVAFGQGMATFNLDAGIKNAGWDGVWAHDNGFINARRCNFSGAGRRGAHFGGHSRGLIQESNLTESGDRGLSCDNGSIVYGRDVNASNSNGVGLWVRGSFVVAPNIIFNDCNQGSKIIDGSTVNIEAASGNNSNDVGIRVENSSTVNLMGASATACDRGLVANNSSTVNARDCNFSNQTRRGVDVQNGSEVNFRNGTAIDCGSFSLRVTFGSIIVGNQSTIDTGSTNISVNTLTSDGIIYQ